MRYALILLIGLPWPVHAQRQLVLVKRDRVLSTFFEGDYIRLILKNGQREEGRIIELAEFSMITSNDTVPFNKIKKVKKQKGQRGGVMTGVGGFLFAAGILYIGIDQINSALGYNRKGLDPTVLNTSLILTATGAIMILMRPHYFRVNTGIFLRTIDRKSPLYLRGSWGGGTGKR